MFESVLTLTMHLLTQIIAIIGPMNAQIAPSLSEIQHLQ